MSESEFSEGTFLELDEREWVILKDECVPLHIPMLWNDAVGMLRKSSEKNLQLFHNRVGIAVRKFEALKLARAPIGMNIPRCPDHDLPMTLRSGISGKYWSCPRYPACRRHKDPQSCFRFKGEPPKTL